MTHNLAKCALFALLCGIATPGFSQNIGINTTGTTPSPNAILDLNTGNSRNLGFILPHVKLSSLNTFSSPIANAKTTKDTGMLVYNTNAAVGNGAGCYCWNGSQWVYVGTIAKATLQANPPDASIKDANSKMVGLGAQITPTSSGNVLIIISGIVSNNKSGDGAQIQICTGTGIPPTNGDPSTGTQGTQLNIADAHKVDLPFTINTIVTGLTPNTTYWIDLSLSSANNSATATLSNISISAVEE